MSNKVEVIIGKSTREDAHNLDFQGERHILRREAMVYPEGTILTRFEELVFDDQIHLLEYPPELESVAVEDFVNFSGGYSGYQAFVHDRVIVDLTCIRHPAPDMYEAVFRGPVTEITFRDPNSGNKQITASKILEFLILGRLRGKYFYHVAFPYLSK